MSLRNPGRGALFYGLGRSCCKGSIHWRKLKVGSIVTFHWPSYSGFPWVELLLGEKESFLPAREKQCHFLSETQGMALPVGVSVVCWVTCPWAFSLSASWLHFKRHFCLLIFTLLTLEKSSFGNSHRTWEACPSSPHGSVFYLGMRGTLRMRGT